MPFNNIQHGQIAVGPFVFSIELITDEPIELKLSVEPVTELDETYALHIICHPSVQRSFTLQQLAIQWDVPAVDMHGFVSGTPSPEELAKLPYWEIHKRAAANVGFPFVSLVHRGGENRAAFGLIDQLTETALDATLSEHTRSYHFHWHKPLSHAVPNLERWEETLFISRARVPWHEVLGAYSHAVDRLWPQPTLAVPQAAYDPVFCTWTAIHHDVDQEWVLCNANIAADLGFGTWLTDDGWFTDQAFFADYRFTGDWQPVEKKFPDFPGHVRAVQEMGLRYILWVAPFMAGASSQQAAQHPELLTGFSERLQVSNLSPWHAQTTEIVTELLVDLAQQYNLDGFKLDFIDFIALDTERPADTPYRTLGEAVYRTLSQTIDRLGELNPELLIEFRNRYTNLASRRYGNLYRASDVPINFSMNRWQVSFLRLLAPDRAVQFDPALWHPDDTDENVAVHLINAIISVPMISIELEHYPPSHLDLIRCWLAFYRAHRDTIIHGRFEPQYLLGRVPLIQFTGANEQIIGLYDNVACSLSEDPIPIWILNASTRPFVDLSPGSLTGEYRVITHDKFGQIVSQDVIHFPVTRLPVEVGGSLEIVNQ